MKRYVIILCWIIYPYFLLAQADTAQHIITGRQNTPEQQRKPYLILISADGFRYDYAKKHHAANLLAFSKEGVSAKSMIPSYPSLTFPNHYTIATGLYPSHHGIADNSFYDRKRKQFYTVSNRTAVEDGSWYGGVPIWVLAEQQEMLSASFYWVGSEAEINGIRPTYYYNYNEDISIEKRIQVVVDWLLLPADRRPHFISFYLPQADHEGHNFGPGSLQTRHAVQMIDSSIKKLADAVAATGLPVNFIFVSDHGMTNVDTAHPVSIPPVDTTLFVISKGGQLIHLYAKDPRAAGPAYKQLKKKENGFSIYLKKDMPARFHYGIKDDLADREGEIIMIPHWPRMFSFSKIKSNPGAHGFDPAIPDMHATFYCWGPAFKKHLVIPSFENIHIYPVMTKILGLKYDHKIDGTGVIADKILK
ncbi:MAG: ectonucleotide pyrophosphatase/phosphodiesterase [Ferruginibacter sp.]